ncbi:MAG: aspartate kinase [Thermoflexibacter sp.]|jgi:aspartate kinase|nr:aspartate kinase [Thermoflexibacter sp.]
MKVLKFGGTSVGSAERMKGVNQLINTEELKIQKRIIVLSAMSGTTNTLVQISEQLYAKNYPQAALIITEMELKYRKTIGELYKKDESKEKASNLLDAQFGHIRSLAKERERFSNLKERILLAKGEQLSTAMFQLFLEENGVESVLLDALEFMRIDENSEPEMDFIEEQLKIELEKYPDNLLFITQGYICKNSFGEIDNLKRGGSDYSASLIGAAVNAEEIQIWTDIDGMHNNDPRIVDKTMPVAQLSFDEAAELAYFGAKILHPSTITPAKAKNIPVRLLNTMAPHLKGTVITKDAADTNIKAVAAKDNITMINIRSTRMLLAYGFLRKVFEIFEKYKTSIDMVTTSEVCVSVTIDNIANLEQIINELEEFSSIEVNKNMSIVCVVGDLISERVGYAEEIFSSLSTVSIKMISYGGSKNNVSMLIDTQDKKAALQGLNKGLFKL